MGCCESVRSRKYVEPLTEFEEIDDLSLEDKSVYRVILLGTGGCGKTTIYNQLNRAYGLPFQEEQRSGLSDFVFGFIILQMKALLQMRKRFEDAAEGEARERYILPLEFEEMADKTEREPMDDPRSVTESFANRIYELWETAALKNTFADRDSKVIADSAPHFFSNVHRLIQPNYIATDEDILLLRRRTTGLLTRRFEIGSNEFELIDTGGERNERKKWVDEFYNIAAVIFVVDLTSYNQTLYEDNTTNAMLETLELFGELVNSKWFLRTSVALFFNKEDLFEEKCKRIPLNVCWPEYAYPDAEEDVSEKEHGIQFIREKFLEKCSRSREAPNVQITCAINSESVTKAFRSVHDNVLDDALAILERGRSMSEHVER